MKLNIVPARTGVQWVKLGVRTFSKQPLALSGLFFMYTAAATLLSVVPLIGIVLALAIVPAATLGLMAATQEAESGRFPMPTVLVSAFRAGRRRLQSMLVLGLLYAAACMAVITLVSLIAGVERGPGSAEAAMEPEFQRWMLVAGLLYLPVSLLFWHAPALVHWYGISPVKSLFFSTVACLRNAKALLMFGLTWVALFVAASILVGLLAAMTGSHQFASAIVLPLALLIAAMFSTSLYFTFRDSFVATPGDARQSSDGEAT